MSLTAAQFDERVAHSRALFPTFTDEQIREAILACLQQEVWANERYQVHVIRGIDGPDELPIVHLSVRRMDRAPVRDWRDMQRIKNQLVGPECEAIELYPAESRVVDTANQYHLFCVADPTWRFPFGWHGGRHVDGRSGAGAVQRPLDEEGQITEARP